MAIYVVGLGPGDGRYLTRQAWDVLNATRKIYLRTERHPAVAELPNHLAATSFDQVYERAESFEQVYAEIVAELLTAARQGEGAGDDVIYAVPGHPLMGEATVTKLLTAAKQAGIQVVVVPGMSFVEPVLAAVGVDGLDGLQVFDAIEVASMLHPPLNTDLPALLGQVYNRTVAGDLKLALMALYPEEHDVVLVHAAGADDEVTEHLPLYAIDRSEGLAHLTTLYVPPLAHRSSLPALAETVAYLRGPHGCPWDQEQSHQSMRPGFLEEVAEVLDALDADDMDALKEELGDLLFHLVFQAQLASESETFTLTDVVAGIDEKLRRRHPHVWGDWEVADSDEVLRNWEDLKQDEKAPDRSLLESVPMSLPGLSRAQKLQERVRRVGFDWPAIEGVVSKFEEEIAELRDAGTKAEQARELGDLLFALVNWSRWLAIDAESAMREANARFERRFRRLETLAEAQGSQLEEMDLEQMERLWEAAKAIEAGE